MLCHVHQCLTRLTVGLGLSIGSPNHYNSESRFGEGYVCYRQNVTGRSRASYIFASKGKGKRETYFQLGSPQIEVGVLKTHSAHRSALAIHPAQHLTAGFYFIVAANTSQDLRRCASPKAFFVVSEFLHGPV